MELTLIRSYIRLKVIFEIIQKIIIVYYCIVYTTYLQGTEDTDVLTLI